MFGKLNHHHHQYHPHHHQIHHQEQEEESQLSPNTAVALRSILKKPKPDPDTTAGGDQGTIEVAKRSRGRPPGSKNKPKPPLIITHEAECAMRPLFLELPTGLDIIDAIARFTHRRNLGLTVLSASGSVTNVCFRQPTTGGGAGIAKLHGSFDILSISATFLPPSLPITASPPSPLPSSFMIALVGPQGQIIGGSIAGSLITSSTVYIVAASFDNPTYHRLPLEEDAVATNNDSTSQVEHQHHLANPNPNPNQLAVEASSCGMSIYHVPPPHQDLIWSPTPRSSPPF